MHVLSCLCQSFFRKGLKGGNGSRSSVFNTSDCKKTNKKNRENILPDVTCFYGWNLFTLHFMCIFIFIFHSVVWLKKKKSENNSHDFVFSFSKNEALNSNH